MTTTDTDPDFTFLSEIGIISLQTVIPGDSGPLNWREEGDKEKSHKGIWWSERPGSVPGKNSGRPRDTRDVWADLCGNSNSRGRMSAGQAGHMAGQMGHVHGTDRTHTRGCPAKILYVYCYFSFPIQNSQVRKKTA